MRSRTLPGLVAAVAVALGLAACGQAAAPGSIPTHDARARGVTGVKVVAVGDIACAPGEATDSGRCQQQATADLVGRIDPKRVIVLGDLQYESGRLADFRASYDTSWGAYKGRTLALPGNHEYNTSGAVGYYRYFRQTTPGYRAVTVNGWRVYLLNSNCDHIDCGAERAWFRADLAAHPVTCSLMAAHFPRYSSGQHGSTKSMTRFWRIAHNHGVDLALAGHDHDYERFAPMDADAHLVDDGITSFVSGTGGKSLYKRNGSAPGSQFFRSTTFGVLVLKLGDGEFAWRFHTTKGTVRDSGSSSCH